ncbi:GNAT family N-acetyltransferase [Metabacillus sp. GX 13764]|uniref:GNAT family N-acetyltransferase n=1 Tax=Metabacillus kandeliae TaxID=2900151 RepID=UPI001E296D4D|nr:GNAT family N-acetyltransferase [Metabacillus kandeliae]
MEILTERLLVIPCSLDIAKSLIIHRKELEERSPIVIPPVWPSSLTQGLLPLYIERLEKSREAYGWGLWLIIHAAEKKIIGDFYIADKPDRDGKVEFSCQINPSYPEQIAFEALNMFFSWLSSQNQVKTVQTECRIENEDMIHLLHKLGFICRKREDYYLLWQICKNGDV